MICLVLCDVCFILSTKLNLKYPEALSIFLAEKCFKTLTVIVVHVSEDKKTDAF